MKNDSPSSMKIAHSDRASGADVSMLIIFDFEDGKLVTNRIDLSEFKTKKSRTSRISIC